LGVTIYRKKSIVKRLIDVLLVDDSINSIVIEKRDIDISIFPVSSLVFVYRALVKVRGGWGLSPNLTC